MKHLPCKKIALYLKSLNKEKIVHLQIDSGMNRLGIRSIDEYLEILNILEKSKNIKITGHIDIESANKNINVLAKEIEDWLQGQVSYKTLTFKDHKYKYQALCFNQIKLSEVIEDLCEFEIKFRVTPNVGVI